MAWLFLCLRDFTLAHRFCCPITLINCVTKISLPYMVQLLHKFWKVCETSNENSVCWSNWGFPLGWSANHQGGSGRWGSVWEYYGCDQGTHFAVLAEHSWMQYMYHMVFNPHVRGGCLPMLWLWPRDTLSRLLILIPLCALPQSTQSGMMSTLALEHERSVYIFIQICTESNLAQYCGYYGPDLRAHSHCWYTRHSLLSSSALAQTICNHAQTIMFYKWRNPPSLGLWWWCWVNAWYGSKNNLTCSQNVWFVWFLNLVPLVWKSVCEGRPSK